MAGRCSRSQALAALALLGVRRRARLLARRCLVPAAADDPGGRRGAAASAAALPFALEQLGALSRRACSASRARPRSSSKRIGVLNAESGTPAVRPRQEVHAGSRQGAGQRRSAAAARAASRRKTSASSTASSRGSSSRSPPSRMRPPRRTLDLMRLPTRLPVPGAELTSTVRQPHDPIAQSPRVPCRARLRGASRHADHRGRRRHGRLRRLPVATSAGWSRSITATA